jgi:hypothetical protein
VVGSVATVGSQLLFRHRLQAHVIITFLNRESMASGSGWPAAGSLSEDWARCPDHS